MATYTIGSDVSDDYVSYAAFRAAATEAAGDIVSFRKGDTFREQITCPASGASGNVITYTAHGSGADPIIDARILQAGWTHEYSLSWADLTNTTDTIGNFGLREKIASTTFSVDGDYVRFKLQARPGETTTVTDSYIGQKASSGDAFDMESGTITQITWDSGGTGTTISAGQEKWSDWIAYSFDNTKDHLVSLGITGGFSRHATDLVDAAYYKNNDQANAGTANVSAYNSSGVSYIESFEIKQINVWQATCMTQAKSVYFDTTKGTEESSIANLDAANEWYWTGNVLYVYSTSDPDTAYTSPGMQVGIANKCINLISKNYLDFENLNLIAGGHGCGYIVGVVDTINFTNVIFDGNNDGLFYPAITSGYGPNWVQNVTFDGCTFKDQPNFSGLSIEDYSHDIIVKNCIASGNGDNGIQAWTSGAAASGPYNIVIENTDAYNNTNYGTGLSYHVKDSIVRYCKTYNNTVGFGGEASGTGNEYYYNISYGNSAKGAEIDNGHTAANWYNNIFYDNGDYGIYIHSGASNGQVIKNNIFYGLSGDSSYMIYVGGTVTITSDNNCFYDTGTNKWHWHGSDYTTFADWKTNSSQDANSVNADPVFIDESTQKFSLQSSSPCIDVGTDVSLALDYAGSFVPCNTVPDIGAFEYIDMRPATAVLNVVAPSVTVSAGYNSAVATGGAMGIGMGMGM